MTDFYKKLMEKSGLDETLVGCALDFGKNIDINELSRLFFDVEPFSVEKTGVLYFEEAFYPFEFYAEILSYCAEKNLSPKEIFLYIYILLLEDSFEDFSSRTGAPELFFNTAKKIAEGAGEYYSQHGKFGLYEYHFLANHVRGNIIRLGEFEYQYGRFDGKRCITLHLPEKADLSREKRLESYRLARLYFGNYPIIGDSWLFYGEHKKMLSEDSRIVDFMNDFEIISTHETHDYSELFHVFGRLSDYSFENLPKATSLQRAYAERVKNKLPVGSGVGRLK